MGRARQGGFGAVLSKMLFWREGEKWLLYYQLMGLAVGWLLVVIDSKKFHVVM